MLPEKENIQNTEEGNPFKLSEQVIKACSDYTDAFLVIGYTKKDREKFFLAVHKNDEKAEELRKLSDAVNAWHCLGGEEMPQFQPQTEAQNHSIGTYKPR